MALTADGAAAGFGLSTFATGFPVAAGVGPIGVAFPPDGSVLVADYTGAVRILPSDTDEQSAGAAVVGQNYGLANATGVAQIGGHIYMNQAANSAVVEVKSDGTLLSTIVNVSNPVNNNLTGMADAARRR